MHLYNVIISCLFCNLIRKYMYDQGTTCSSTIFYVSHLFITFIKVPREREVLLPLLGKRWGEKVHCFPRNGRRKWPVLISRPLPLWIPFKLPAASSCRDPASERSVRRELNRSDGLLTLWRVPRPLSPRGWTSLVCLGSLTWSKLLSVGTSPEKFWTSTGSLTQTSLDNIYW